MRNVSIPPQRIRLGALICTAALVFAACGDESDDASGDTVDTSDTVEPEERPASTDAEPVETDPPATDPPVTDPPATTSTTTTTLVDAPVETAAPATDAPTTEAPASSVPPGVGAGSSGSEPSVTDAPVTTVADSSDCLVGNWTISAEQMTGFYSAALAGAGLSDGFIEVTDGGVGLVLGADGTYVYDSDFRVSVSLMGLEGGGTATGTVSGQWSVDGDVILTEVVDSNLSIDISIGGMPSADSLFGNELLEGSPIQDSPYSCDGPTILYFTGDGNPRHPVTLTPA